MFKEEENREIKLRNTWSYYAGVGFKREIEFFYSVGINFSVHNLTSDYLDGYKGSTKIEDLYFFTQIEFCLKLARKQIYNKQGFVK